MRNRTKKIRAACKTKRRYEFAHQAANAAKHTGVGQWRLGYYECSHCHGWHVGHRPYWLRQSLRDRKGT